MNRLDLGKVTVGLAIAAAIAGSACNRDEAGPVVQTTTGVQPRMEPATVSGTPTIETTSELDVKHLTVESVTPSSQPCAD